MKFSLEWCSILVSTANFEGGPKNPSKGVSMKFLVSAADAQLGVDSGSKEDGAIYKGMWAMTLPSWRLINSIIYRRMLMRVTYTVVQATCSVACLE